MASTSRAPWKADEMMWDSGCKLIDTLGINKVSRTLGDRTRSLIGKPAIARGL